MRAYLTQYPYQGSGSWLLLCLILMVLSGCDQSPPSTNNKSTIGDITTKRLLDAGGNTEDW